MNEAREISANFTPALIAYVACTVAGVALAAVAWIIRHYAKRVELLELRLQTVEVTGAKKASHELLEAQLRSHELMLPKLASHDRVTQVEHTAAIALQVEHKENNAALGRASDRLQTRIDDVAKRANDQFTDLKIDVKVLLDRHERRGE